MSTEQDDQFVIIKNPNDCVICQKGNAEKHITTILANNLASQLRKFHDEDLLSTELSERLLEKGESCLATQLKLGSYRIHKACYDKFNESKRSRATSAKKRKMEEGGKKSRPTRSQCSSSIPFGEEYCMYCELPAKDDIRHPENNNPLHAAASKHIASEYVDRFTDNVREMATKLGDTKILNVLGTDVRSSELFYHNVCHAKFKRKYDKLVASESPSQSFSQLEDFIAMSSVKDYVDDSDEESFSLKSLESLYLEKLSELGYIANSHITRFASKLEIANIGLTISQSNKSHNSYIAIKTNALKNIIPDNDWIQMARSVVDPIRKEILGAHEMDKPQMSDLEPWFIMYPKLKFLISLLCFGKPEVNNSSLPLDTICQLIVFNSKQRFRNSRSNVDPGQEVIVRHHRNAECPIINYMTIKLYSTVRSKTLIQILFQFGIVLSYDRILTFLDELSQVVKVYYADSDNKALPSSLRKRLFTIFTDDNLDKNSSSVDAKHNFHGTGAAVIQFPSELSPGITRPLKKFKSLTQDELKIKSCDGLDAFVSIPEINVKANTSCPIQTVNICDSHQNDLKKIKEEQLDQENKWLETAVKNFKDNVPIDEQMASWTAYHLSKKRDKSCRIPTIISSLPLIDYKSNTSELQFHLMKKTLEYTNYLNPGQTAVGCSDQPLYAIKKTIQWAYPDLFGNTYFAFMGGLHIEQAALVCIGQLLTGTGIEDIIKNADLDTTGLVTAVCDVNNIKKARYTLQIIAVVLMQMLNDAYIDSQDEVTFDLWLTSQSDVMFQYWSNILYYIKSLLMLVRSFREANFSLFIAALENIVPLFFTLDHTHYSRWLSVFIYDLKILPVKFPDLHKEFESGKFVVNTKGNDFSKIALDQAQEHCNKKIKSTAGYIDLVNYDDKEFLRKLELCLPEMHQYLTNFECSSSFINQRHKESSKSFNIKFIEDCKKVYSKILTNPFSCSDFRRLNSSYLFPDVIVQDVKQMFESGQDQYNNFYKTRFVTGSEDILKSKIKRNMFKLPKDASEVQIESPRLSITEQTFNKIRDACKYRSMAAKQLFMGEITGLPECFVNKKNCKPYHNAKSMIVDLIAPKNCNTELTDVEGLIVDLSVITRVQAAIISKEKTFGFLSTQILKHIEGAATKLNASRVDIVSDHYSSKSIKYHTRDARKIKSSGLQVEVKADDKLPDNITTTFFPDEQNKMAFNRLIVENCRNPTLWTWKKDFCITFDTDNVLTEMGLKTIHKPNMIEVLEEADNRIVCHIENMLKTGISKISVRTVDSDVVVILLSFLSTFLKLNKDLELYVDYNTGNNRRVISINACHKLLGENISQSLPFFHSFTGADSTCSFFSITKKIWFSLWLECPMKNDLTECFQKMSRCPSESDVSSSLKVLAKYVMYAYKSRGQNDYDENRFEIFQNLATNDLRNVPPSVAALALHINRCAYQAGWVWGNSLTQVSPPSPESWGWKFYKGHLQIKWTYNVQHLDLDKVIQTCNCRTDKCTGCKCAKSNHNCLSFCKCCRRCKNV